MEFQENDKKAEIEAVSNVKFYLTSSERSNDRESWRGKKKKKTEMKVMVVGVSKGD